MDLKLAASITALPGLVYLFGAAESSRLHFCSDVVFHLEHIQPSVGMFEVTKCRLRREDRGKVPFTLGTSTWGPPIQIGLSWRARAQDHWARSLLYEYDVALSFAGEDRSYVAEVANTLKDLNVRVFYDTFEEHRLWGRDLAVVFGEIFSRKAQFCVLFISAAYARKAWTNHERRFAIQAMIERVDRDYLLPARFDNTELPGLPKTIKYIDLQSITPTAFAELILKRIRGI
jgi:hypothetical protein